LATYTYEDSVELWNVGTGKRVAVLRQLSYDKNYPNRTIFSPDSSTVATWNKSGGKIHLWSVTDGHHIFTLENTPDDVGSSLEIRFSFDGVFVSASLGNLGDTGDSFVRIWDTTTATLLGKINKEYSAAFHPRKRLLITENESGFINIRLLN
jgi:WD40 repeat protein